MAQELAIRDRMDGVPAVQTIAQHFVKSGFFKETRDLSQAVVKIMAGAEMGFGPFASMKGVDVIEGKTAISAGLIAAAIGRGGKYRYRVREHSETACAIEFFEGKESLGISRFGIDDAQKAGLAGKQVWKQYPRNMLFARAMSNGARWYCADVFAGAVYTPEELGAEVDEDGEIVQPAQPAPAIRMVDAVTAEVSLPAERAAAPTLDYKQTLTWLQKLPAAETRRPAQREALARLCDEKLPAEAQRYGLELPTRFDDMDPAAWATQAVMSLAERDESQPF